MPAPKPPETASPPVSPDRAEDEGGVWKMGSPPLETTQLPPAPTSLEEVVVDVPMEPFRATDSPPLTSPTRLHPFGEASGSRPPATELAQGMATFEMPTSPSFGEDGFGGFASGFGDGADPWGAGGTGGAREDWGGEGSRRGSGFDAAQEKDEDEDEGAGWGGTREGRKGSLPARTQGEDDWEEAQRRIRLKQERAVSVSPAEQCGNLG